VGSITCSVGTGARLSVIDSAHAESGSGASLEWRIPSLESTVKAIIANKWSKTGGANVAEILPKELLSCRWAMRAGHELVWLR